MRSLLLSDKGARTKRAAWWLNGWFDGFIGWNLGWWEQPNWAWGVLYKAEISLMTSTNCINYIFYRNPWALVVLSVCLLMKNDWQMDVMTLCWCLYRRYKINTIRPSRQKIFRWCCHDIDVNVAVFWQIILTKRILQATRTRTGNASVGVCFCSTSARSLSCLTWALIRPVDWSGSSRAGSPLSAAQPSSTEDLSALCG